MSRIKRFLEDVEHIEVNGEKRVLMDIEQFVDAFLFIAEGRGIDPEFTAFVHNHYLAGKRHKKKRIGKKKVKQAVSAMLSILMRST